MSGFLQKYNTDDVFLRNLIVGLLKSLNDKIKYRQTDDKQNIMEVYIPFYYSLSGDESFMQDSFLNYVNCNDETPVAEGNYDVIPRGVVVFQSAQINTQALTNKFTRMSYTMEDEKGQMKSYSSITNSIPLDLAFEVTIRIDTLLDAFKVFQSVITTLYKTYKFSFDYEGLKIDAQVGFPESYDMSKQLDFTYSSNPRYLDFKFNIEIESYLPEKDLTTERFKGNLMQSGIRYQEIISAKTLEKTDSDIL